MSGTFDGVTKMKAALGALNSVFYTVASKDDLALRQYGGNCDGDNTKLLIRFGQNNTPRMRKSVTDFAAKGNAILSGAPTLAHAVIEATGDFNDKQRSKRIVVIAGSSDSCLGGDLSATVGAVKERAARLRTSGSQISSEFTFIGLALPPEQQASVSTIAHAIGGRTAFVNRRQDLNSVIERVVRGSEIERSPEPPGESSSPKPLDMKTNEKDGLIHVWMPAGTFIMGCSPDDSECDTEEKPPHKVTLTRGFWIGETEVTQEAYERVMRTNPSEFEGAKRPVESVTWHAALAYCKSVGMGLPTEAQWEYASRGGEASTRMGSLGTMAWYFGNSGSATHEVRTKKKNGYGLYDVLGNVAEWTADWREPTLYGPVSNGYSGRQQVDPVGSANGEERIVRGGDWATKADNLRLSARDHSNPENHGSGIGFRCVGKEP